MKITFFSLILICLAFTSCVTFKQFDNRAKAAREPAYEAAIITKDGAVHTGQKLTHRNYDPYDHNLVRVINRDNALTLDGKQYTDRDVIAFQDKKAFHKEYGGLFLIRLVSGKINLYYFDNTGYDNSSISSNHRKSFFYFEKENNKIFGIGMADLKNAVKDNKQVFNQLNAYYPKDSYAKELSIEKLVSVVEAYNK